MQINKVIVVLFGCFLCLTMCQELQKSSDLKGEETSAKCEYTMFFELKEEVVILIYLTLAMVTEQQIPLLV